MKYEYRDIWIRMPDGTEKGYQISYPFYTDISEINENLQVIADFANGRCNLITLSPKFRLWPMKVPEVQDGKS